MTDTGLRRTAGTIWAFVPLLALAGIVAWLLGFGLILIGEADERCSQEIIVHEGARYLRMQDSLVPLEHSCLFDDGSTYEDVQPWVNPVFFGGIGGASALAAVATGLQIAAARAERRPKPA